MRSNRLLAATLATAGLCMAQGLYPADRQGKLKAGDPALDFTLKIRHSERKVTLSSYRNNLPVALVFGSYT